MFYCNTGKIISKNFVAIDNLNYDQLSETLGRIRRSGRLAVHCLRPLQDCDEGRGHGHCGNRRMLSGDVDINTKCMMGGGTCDKVGKVGLNVCF